MSQLAAVKPASKTLDRHWDDFVAVAPGGTHLQSSRWAEVKRLSGWDSMRLEAREGGEIVGGCQILLRRIARVGSIAYVTRGPLGRANRPDVAREVLAGVLDFARSRHLLLAKIQPPERSDALLPMLEEDGWTRSDLTVAPDATVRVDVRKSDDELKRCLRSNMRRNITTAQRHGVKVREGGIDDVPAFGKLVEATSKRQEFRPYAADYYEHVMRTFGAGVDARLLIAERGGDVLAGSFLVLFGDTATFKMGAWSGTHPEARASTLVHWEGIRLARELGCRYYDFDGVARPVAARLLAGEKVSNLRGVDHFKLGFGADPVLLPPTFDRSYHLLGVGVRRLAPTIRRHTRFAETLAGRRA